MVSNSKLRVIYHPNAEQSDFFAVEVENEREAYRMKSAFTRLHTWFTTLGKISESKPLIAVQMYEPTPESEAGDPDEIWVWQHYWNYHEDCDWEGYELKHFLK